MAESEARKAWAKENTVVVSVKLQRSTDADILERLEGEENRNGFIKAAIRRQIAYDNAVAEVQRVIAENMEKKTGRQ